MAFSGYYNRVHVLCVSSNILHFLLSVSRVFVKLHYDCFNCYRNHVSTCLPPCLLAYTCSSHFNSWFIMPSACYQSNPYHSCEVKDEHSECTIHWTWKNLGRSVMELLRIYSCWETHNFTYKNFTQYSFYIAIFSFLLNVYASISKLPPLK